MAGIVVDAAIEVQRSLGGPGLLDTVYEEALAFERESRGLDVVRQKTVPLVYKASVLRRTCASICSWTSHRRVQGHGRIQQSIRSAGPRPPAALESLARDRHQRWRGE
ncbi:GxxExxY protein [Sorangium sp. So ce119]|uniref:GxxExxY protein n=1 Tax=Sorangium sp. So ce119 TaxID=3133279 RepID=UPI003F606FE1